MFVDVIYLRENSFIELLQIPQKILNKCEEKTEEKWFSEFQKSQK